MAELEVSQTPLGSALDGAQARRGKPKVSDQTIYESIYEAVLAQRLPPGAKLPEVALAELFGVSRSIVRKALTRLTSDHVIEQRHSQMATVAKPGVEETRQIFEARCAIEGELVRLIAGKLEKSELRELRRLISDEKAAHDHGKMQNRSRHSMQLHLFLADHCHNKVLGGILRELVLRTSIAISMYKAKGVDSCFQGDDHARLADLIENGGGDAAAALVRRHLQTLENLLHFNEQESAIDLSRILQVNGRCLGLME
jgi:DNA-binding GntR family transcriptional regulator